MDKARSSTTPRICFGVLTVSDTCSFNPEQDTSGPTAIKLIKEQSKLYDVVLSDCVPDDPTRIYDVLMQWIGSDSVHVILTVGGTGLTERDQTSETVLQLIGSNGKRLNGIEHALYRASFSHTPLAALSRMVAGVCSKVVLITLPGSERAVSQCVPVLFPFLPHAVHQIRGCHWLVKQAHSCLPSDTDGFESFQSTTYNVVNRVRRSKFPMISVEECQRKLFEISGSLYSSLKDEAVFYKNALGRTLSRTVRSRHVVPPYDASIMDGYAVKFDDAVGHRIVLGASCAEKKSSTDISKLMVSSGTCIRVSTGGRIPPGADSVVPVENTRMLTKKYLFNGEEEEDLVEVSEAPSKVGQFIRPKGFDLTTNDVFHRGLRIGPVELGLFATAGLLAPWPNPPTEILVENQSPLDNLLLDQLSHGGFLPCIRQPKIGLLSTGDELIDCVLSGPLESIRDANRPTLSMILRKHGFHHVTDLGIVGDIYEQLVEAFIHAFNQCDLLITTGGVSMGEKDLVTRVLLDKFGASIHFARVHMKPGKPTTFASVLHQSGHAPSKQVLILSLPGNPASVFVTAHLFVLPLLRRLESRPENQWTFPTIQVYLNHSVKLGDRPEYKRAQLTWKPETSLSLPGDESRTEHNAPVVTHSKPFATCEHIGSQMSSRLASCMDTNLLLVLPAANAEQNITEFVAGTVVDALLINNY